MNEESCKAMIEGERRIALTAMKRNGMPSWVCDIVFRSATVNAVSVVTVMSRSTDLASSLARRQAMYETKSERPHLSSAQIGKWFDRDASAVIHAIARYQDEAGLPKLVGANWRGKNDAALARYRRIMAERAVA